ncbi:MAG: 16S rRNA (guanine(966)-N(2))-methyltransferase RsmD [Ignavibacteriales bacterium]|nr:MAG: 16S rRNA (guanine(966)-N(2))-methyltransferase RsmD [Ignavibacteriales bacterium]
MRMRIISGEFKGRFIKVPQSDKIRPTTDRVRETLFNLLSNRLDFTNIRALDLYAGSGSLGIECISRGASEVHFVERDRFIYSNLEENISSLSIKDRCSVYNMEVLSFVNKLVTVKYDLILADPPFFKDDIYKVVEAILNNNYLTDEGLLIIERSIQTQEEDFLHFNIEPFKIIGDACLYQIKSTK